MSEPDRNTVTRFAHTGGNAVPEYVVRSVKITPLGRVKAVKVRNVSEYEAGCSLHTECFGHMCKTPSGCMLVPQSLAAAKGDTPNEYLKAAKMAFSGDADGYRGALKSINLTKEGHMRKDILGTTVSGSARLIIVPQVQFPKGNIALPRNIAQLIRTPARDRDTETGMYTNVMGERHVEDGDWCILIRPPSLTYLSTEPMRVRLWDVPTLGISPDDVGYWHGDFDGDEMHMYPIYDKESIEECERWSRSGHAPFKVEADKLESMGYINVNGRPFPFMNMTNVPMSHIRDGGKMPEFSKGARMKKEHYEATGLRFTSNIEKDYVRESIRGQKDVATQQLTQGAIGYMSRLAKIVSMCFVRRDGDLLVQTSDGLQVLRENVGDSYGCPCLRATSYICSQAQQSALDSHRAGSERMPAYDMISNMFAGGDDTVAVVQRDSSLIEHASWKAMKDNGCVVVVSREAVEEHGADSVIASYSPWILSRAADPVGVCTAGVVMVCNYFKVAVSRDELDDFVRMLTFRCGASSSPITCADGLRPRGIGWVDHLMATSYSSIGDICSDDVAAETPVTGTCAVFTGNLMHLNG